MTRFYIDNKLVDSLDDTKIQGIAGGTFLLEPTIFLYPQNFILDTLETFVSITRPCLFRKSLVCIVNVTPPV